MERAREMEKALKNLIASIVDESSDDEDSSLQYDNFLDEAIQTFEGLLIVKPKKEVSVPEQFLCPISQELMMDPVLITTGYTFERDNIQELLDSGNAICPKSGHPIINTCLTPNKAIKSSIMEWCNDNGVHYPTQEANREGEAGSSGGS